MNKIKKYIWLMVCVDFALLYLIFNQQTPFPHTEKEWKQTVSNRIEVDSKGKIAITFDDGPHPVYTEKLLDGLEKRGVVATFFVTGKNVELYPDIIKKMQEGGHLIGNHTYHHTQLTTANANSFEREIVETNRAIQKVTGQETMYIRPPYGSWNKVYEKSLNMFPILWTVDPLDWCNTNAEEIAQKVVTKAKENDIILMHDCYDSSVTAALLVIDELRKEGYEFVTVEDILFD